MEMSSKCPRTAIRGWRIVMGLGAASLASTACADRGPQPIELSFEATLGDRPIACATRFTGVGTAGTTVEIGDARFYVSNLRLVREDGGEVPVELDQSSPWQVEGTALLDFEDGTGRCSEVGTAETNHSVVGRVPGGRYSGLRFDLGVPDAQNHGDVTLAPAPLNLVCFRHVGGDAVNAAIVDRVNRDGEIFITHTKLNDVYTIRMVVGQTRTEQEHVQRAWTLIRAAADAVVHEQTADVA